MLQCKIQLNKPIKGCEYEAGSRIVIKPEARLDHLTFKVHKFNNRPRPEKSKNIVYFPSFSEFGSEIVSVLYIIPQLLQRKYSGKYSIVVGWAGRAFLYKHLVDEFWELSDEYQFLREKCRAFHHVSRNLKKLEKNLDKQGALVRDNEYGVFALTELYPDVARAKEKVVWIPGPNQSKIDSISQYIKPNSVAIIARNRSCYGRNLQPEFYVKLINLLRDMEYEPIWLGEKSTTLSCPVKDVFDFNTTPYSSDLESTLALISKVKFTVQFWTASTRLAGLVGTPYIIFESPDQIYGSGQEGFRLKLCTKSDGKIVLSHFWKVYENHEEAINLIRRTILDILKGDFSTITGMVEDEGYINFIKNYE